MIQQPRQTCLQKHPTGGLCIYVKKTFPPPPIPILKTVSPYGTLKVCLRGEATFYTGFITEKGKINEFLPLVFARKRE